MARYLWPLRDAFAAAIVSWFEVAPDTAVHVVPPFAEVSHLTVGAGEPDAAASKTAFWPSSTVALAGCAVTCGAACTVSVATLLVAVPATFVNTARYLLPFSPTFALAIESVLDVAPEIEPHDAPASVETSHWTVGAGVPEAMDVKLALWPC